VRGMSTIVNCAAYAGGKRVGDVAVEDISLVLYLSQPMRAETFVVRKTSFEGSRSLESDLLYLMTEFATYGVVSIDHLKLNYKLSETTAYRLMVSLSTYWRAVDGDETRFQPSPQLHKILEVSGYA